MAVTTAVLALLLSSASAASQYSSIELYTTNEIWGTLQASTSAFTYDTLWKATTDQSSYLMNIVPSNVDTDYIRIYNPAKLVYLCCPGKSGGVCYASSVGIGDECSFKMMADFSGAYGFFLYSQQEYSNHYFLTISSTKGIYPYLLYDYYNGVAYAEQLINVDAAASKYISTTKNARGLCEIGQYSNNGVCTACSTQCKDCQKAATTCTACTSPLHLTESTCNSCKDLNCKICKGDNVSCLQCISGYHPKEGYCIESQCIGAEYWSDAKASCTECGIQNCNKCLSASTCGTCSEVTTMQTSTSDTTGVSAGLSSSSGATAGVSYEHSVQTSGIVCTTGNAFQLYNMSAFSMVAIITALLY